MSITVLSVVTNCDKYLLQIMTAKLLQIATILLQTVTAITNCHKFITNYDSYYKLQQSLQITTEQIPVGFRAILMSFLRLF